MAAAATVERQQVTDCLPMTLAPQMTYAVPELGFDDQARLRTGQLIAATLSEHAPIAEVAELEEPIQSLYEAGVLAAEGDARGWQMVEINAKTDMIERGIKVGHVMMPVPLTISEKGKISQYGQTAESIQSNSLRYGSRHPVMRKRIEAEARNVYRTEFLNDQGWLDDHSMVVFSLAENLPEEGFFTNTMSCAMQVTSKNSEGLTVETAFVAGIAKPDDRPHDKGTLMTLGKTLNIDFSNMTPAEIIDTPVLIHNSLIKNGVIDIVEMWDDAAGGTFFGENRPREDYLVYKKKCAEREASWQPKVELVSQEFVSQVGGLRNPVEASTLLGKLTEKHLVEQAVFDTSIDARVLGEVAAQEIYAARFYIEQGDYEQGLEHMKTAKQTARSSSCPGGAKGSSSDSAEGEGNKSSEKECTYISKECPLCGKKNVLTTVTKTHIKGSCKCVKKL